MAFYAHFNMDSGSVSSSSGLIYCARDVAEKQHKPTSFPKTFHVLFMSDVLRNTMTQLRLNNAMALHIYSHLTDSLSLHYIGSWKIYS